MAKNEDKLIFIDFNGSDWCPPCKMIAPLVDEIARTYEGQLRVGAVDVDVHPEIQMQYGVMGLPTLILFQHGQPVQRIIGFQPRGRIEAQLKPHLEAEKA